MQFQVPQFIDIEDKIFGNFTLKQFLYITGALGMDYMLWVKLPTFLSLPLIIAISGLAWSLSFMPIDRFGKPFSQILESAFTFYKNEKLYVWRRTPRKNIPTKEKRDERTVQIQMPSVSDSKLKDISWGLEIKSDGTE